MDLRNENEISNRDIASEEEQYVEDKFEEFKNLSEDEEEDKEMMEIENLYEFWTETEK
jgi:hypothetical protein